MVQVKTYHIYQPQMDFDWSYVLSAPLTTPIQTSKNDQNPMMIWKDRCICALVEEENIDSSSKNVVMAVGYFSGKTFNCLHFGHPLSLTSSIWDLNALLKLPSKVNDTMSKAESKMTSVVMWKKITVLWKLNLLTKPAHGHKTKEMKVELAGSTFVLRTETARGCLRWCNHASGEQRRPAYL